MNQPTITNTDPSEMQMFNGVFRDRLVTVGIGEVLAKYTVLGWDTTNNKTIVCTSNSAVGADVPRFILMTEIDNSAGGVALDSTVQVLVSGEVDGAKLVFDNGTDTLDTENTGGVKLRDALKTEGIIVNTRNVLDELDNQ